MNVVTFTELRKNLKQIMDAAADQYEPVVIQRPHASNMVMLTQESYESLKETAYLLSQPANAKHLRKSLKNAKQGGMLVRKLIEE